MAGGLASIGGTVIGVFIIALLQAGNHGIWPWHKD